MTVKCYRCGKRVRANIKGSTKCPRCRVIIAYIDGKGKVVEVK